MKTQEPSGQLLLQQRMTELFPHLIDKLQASESQSDLEIRQKAMNYFLQTGLPHQGLERWRNTDFSQAFSTSYHYEFEPDNKKQNIGEIFRCEVHNFETFLFTQVNGWYYYENQELTTLPEGVVVGSLAAARKHFPEIFKKHYGKYADIESCGLCALNTAFALDGFFILVPDNVEISKPIQIVNMVNHDKNLFVQPRNLIVMGKNSRLTLVQCDDSLQHQYHLVNSVSEIFLDQGASIDHYKLQNKDDKSTMVNSIYVHQEKDSRLNTNTLTLNGGNIRNNSFVNLSGKGAEAHIYGLYLIDRKQHIDNFVFVSHSETDCTSNELFKGIIDDEASAVFNGHILVEKDAQRTNAFQNNKNILLTDTAKVNTKPFLEIYADDVKCSHGATVGQLDPDAMFYLKQRGICERNARMLLMYAFAAEVVQKISIESLRERIDKLVMKRLRGELTICDQCVLHCAEKPEFVFEIDMSKI